MPLPTLDTLLNSEFALSAASGIARLTPEPLSERLLAAGVATVARNAESTIVRAVRSNQWVVSGESLPHGDLERATRENLAFMGRFVFDLYRFGSRPEGLAEKVVIGESMREWMRADGPVMFAVSHLGNFDLAGRALAAGGLRAQILSVPQPTDAYQAQNEARRRLGFDLTPISTSALRLAEKRLSEGGFVITGIDRPLAEAGREVTFFGRAARLPDVHVRLAGRRRVPIVFVHVWLAEDGRYRVEAEEVPIEGGRDAATVRADCERVLQVAERDIRAYPRQWAMPHVVWPQALADLEGSSPSTP